LPCVHSEWQASLIASFLEKMALLVAHKAFHSVSVVHSAKSFLGPLAEALSVDKAFSGTREAQHG